MAATTHYVGLFGLGCVARGLITIFRAREDYKVHWICYVRDNGTCRLTAEDIEAADITLVPTPADVLKDQRLRAVVELLGGSDGLAWDVVSKSLETGTPVVTANKALLAKHMEEIDEALLKITPAGRFPILRCEGSVCGGVPILNTLLHYYDAAGDKISSVAGIVNGSTNYLLSTMQADHQATMSAVIADMQNKGYLEADYSLDLNGSDARHKLCILARIAMGVAVKESDCLTIGLPQLIREDFAFAETQACALKLIGSLVKEGDSHVRLSVMPTFVPLTEAAAHAKGADNLIQVKSEYLGDLVLRGAGAGGLATGMAVASDLVGILEAVESGVYHYPSPFPLKKRGGALEVVNVAEERRNWIVRLNGSLGENIEDGWQIVGSVGENEVYVKVNGTHSELAERLKGGVVFGVWGQDGSGSGSGSAKD